MNPQPYLFAEQSKAGQFEITASTPTELTVPALRGKTAVVVEDEGITQLQIRKSLTQAGMKVLGSAASGLEGVEVVLKNRPELVVMDIKMPGEIDGLEAVRRILGEYRTCVILLTAYDTFREQARELGVTGYIVKPVTF